MAVAILHPAAPAAVHSGSLVAWLWPVALLGLMLACAMVLGSRR